MIMDFDGRGEGMKRAFEKTEEEILEINWKKKKQKKQHMERDVFCVHAQLCLTLCNPMACSLPDSSVRGILQARVLE